MTQLPHDEHPLDKSPDYILSELHAMANDMEYFQGDWIEWAKKEIAKHYTPNTEVERLVREGRIDELKKAFDVDTIPFVPVTPCGDCIGIYEYSQDRIKELSNPDKETK